VGPGTEQVVKSSIYLLLSAFVGFGILLLVGIICWLLC